MEYEIVIIGGSFAGQAAALQLGRARRNVLLVDVGRPRNRFAQASHGFLGQDGTAPSALVSTFADQLSHYETVVQLTGEVVAAECADGSFRVALENGDAVQAEKLILAGGIRDILPEIPGLTARWGVSVLHCPYCHGYELGQRPVGVLGTGENAFHQAMLVRDWGPTTLFAQGSLELSEDQKSALSKRDVRIEPNPVVELLGPGDALEAVRLADGQAASIAGLFVAPRTEIVGNLASELGCTVEEGPTGCFISVDAMQRTSVPGVFAAGDASAAMSNATLSAAGGVRAAAAAHHSLVFGEMEAA